MNTKQKRLGAAIAAILIIIVAVVATDDGGLVTLGRCAIGDGLYVRPNPAVDFVGDFYGLKFKGNTENLIDMEVHGFGGFEKPILQLMEDTLAIMAPAGEGVVLDVGSNVGQHSMFMSRTAKVVHSVEPFPPVSARMNEMLELNHIKNVVLHPVGYSNQNGSLPFTPPDEGNHGIGTFSSDRRAGAEKQIELPLLRGDDDLANTGVTRVDLVKLDIEGYEKFALEGLAKTMKANRPAVVMELNCTNQEGFHNAEDLKKAFPENYVFYDIVQRRDYKWTVGGTEIMCGRSHGEYWLVPFDMRFDEDSRNILAIPAEKKDKISLYRDK